MTLHHSKEHLFRQSPAKGQRVASQGRTHRELLKDPEYRRMVQIIRRGK